MVQLSDSDLCSNRLQLVVVRKIYITWKTIHNEYLLVYFRFPYLVENSWEINPSRMVCMCLSRSRVLMEFNPCLFPYNTKRLGDIEMLCVRVCVRHKAC